MDEYYYAREGDCFIDRKNSRVLKAMTLEGRFVNICIIQGNSDHRLGEPLGITQESANKFLKELFERYYSFDDYLKQLER